MNSWGARIKAAISGEVDGADVRALLASTVPLAALQQTLADRRLEAEIGHQGEEWLVAVDLSEVAAPLWLAEAATTLAGSLVDAEDEAHPARPGTLSAVSHYHAMVLLEPVGQILSAVSATLADPTRRTNLPLPLLFGQQAIATDRTLSSLPVAYLRGLLLGADRLEGAAQAALQATGERVGRSPAPPSLSSGLQRLRGDLAATGASLEIQRAAAAALLASSATGTALPQLAASLWNGIDALLRIGQLANAPQLLPGFALQAPPRQPAAAPLARPAERSFQPPPQRPARIAAPRPRDPVVAPATAPPEVATEEPARALPEVSPIWRVTPDVAKQTPPHLVAAPEPAARALPQIGPPEGPAATIPRAAPAAALHPQPEPPERNRSMPEIGGPPPPRTPDPAAVLRPPSQPAEHRPMPEIAPRSAPDARGSGAPPANAPGTLSHPDQPHSLPRIGDSGPPPKEGGRRIEPKDRWLLSSPSTRHRLRAAGHEEQAEGALTAFWTVRDWALSPAAATYIDQLAALQATGNAVQSGRSLDESPYPPIYRVAAGSLTVLGETLQRGMLFAFDYPHDRLLRLASTDGIPD